MPIDARDDQELQSPSEAELAAFYGEIGRRIRAARVDLGLKQDDLARDLRLARSSVANLEAGRQRVPVHTLLLAADALQSRLEDLVPPLEVEPELRSHLGLEPDVPDHHLKLVQSVVLATRVEGSG